MSRKIIPISINDNDVLEFLETKENRSQYIRELIKKDMNRNGLSDEMKRMIIDFIKQNYGNIQVDNTNDLINFQSEINDIFDMK